MPREQQEKQITSQQLQEALVVVVLSPESEAKLLAFLQTLQDESTPQVGDFFIYILKFIEYNSSWYIQLRHDLQQVKVEFTTLEREVQAAVAASSQDRSPPLAAQLAPWASAPYLTVESSVFVDPDGTISRKMGQVGNNITVTFSSDDEIASQKAKLFGSLAKIDTFTG